MSSKNKKKKKVGNGVIAGIVKLGADWFYRKRVVPSKKGKGKKERPRNSNRERREQGER
jgi:hypothetical protein